MITIKQAHQAVKPWPGKKLGFFCFSCCSPFPILSRTECRQVANSKKNSKLFVAIKKGFVPFSKTLGQAYSHLPLTTKHADCKTQTDQYCGTIVYYSISTNDQSSTFLAGISNKVPSSSKEMLLQSLLADRRLCSITARSNIVDPVRPQNHKFITSKN